MRGKGSRLNRVRLACRITPAYAGKSTVQGRNAYHGQNHPRVCGEKALPASWRLPVPGSPPRMRGKADFDVCSDRQCGITPAYAGKRCPRDRGAGQNQDYPRVCGEKEIAAGRDVAYWGSPPRVRGKDGCRIDVDFGIGITPACAGKRRPESLLHT